MGPHALIALCKANAGDDPELKFVHRDVSALNIVLYRPQTVDSDGQPTLRSQDNRRGYLVDWDLACSEQMTTEDEKEPPYSVSGTFA